MVSLPAALLRWIGLGAWIKHKASEPMINRDQRAQPEEPEKRTRHE